MSGLPDLSAVASDLFRIDWNRHSAAQWQTMIDNCARTTLTQSPLYATAAAEVLGVTNDHGLIRFQGQPIGMVIVERRRTIGGAANCSLYRGPVWIHDEIPRQMLKLVLKQLRRRHRWWRGLPLIFHPELTDTPGNRRLLADAGFRRVAEGYATVWLDLAEPLEALRAGLHQKWRNQLKQGEDNDLDIVVATDEAQFEWLYANHSVHMAEHDYRGPSPELLRALQTHAPADQQPLLLLARHQGEPVAGVLLTRHGNSATYLVGWTGAEGRRLRAHNVLLWRAVEHLKSANLRWLDLGGISADAPNVAHFKRGMGGDLTVLVGGYV